MTDHKYAAFTALDPFFEISRQGLAGLVDGDHYFDTIADDAVFEFRYIFPGWPQTLNDREALMALYAGYGNRSFRSGTVEIGAVFFWAGAGCRERESQGTGYRRQATVRNIPELRRNIENRS